MIDLIDWFFVF